MSRPPSNSPTEPGTQQSTEPDAQQGGSQLGASDPALTEDGALSLLAQADLPVETLEKLARNGNALKFRKVKLALIAHAHSPRHISLPLLRQLYTFDLMQVALTPVVPGDLKRAAEESLCSRLESISAGERVALARRASGRVAGALLPDKDVRVMQAALQNPRLSEAHIVQALMRPAAPVAMVEAVCHHREWSLRREVRAALLRNEKTPMARAMEFARSFPPAQLREILRTSRLPENIKGYLLRDLALRGRGAGASETA